MLTRIETVEIKRKNLLKGGGVKQIDAQHNAGKLTARERITKLVDPGTFQESDLWIRSMKTGLDIDNRELPGDGIITGFGKISNRPAYVISEDITILGGTFGVGFLYKITRIMEMAVQHGIPYVQMIDSGGERIHDIFGRPGYRPILGGRAPIGNTSTIYQAPGLASGVIPQITLMLGPSYAGSAYSPTMADFFIMRKGTAFMSVASPQLLKTVTHQEVTQEEIGGSTLHATVTGIADFLLNTDEEVIEKCRDLMTYLPLNFREKPPFVDMNDNPYRRDERLLTIVSENPPQPYDMHEVIRSILDQGQFLEIQEAYARSLITGLGRLDGHTVGIIANNPCEAGGLLTLNTCDKQARFIRCCDAFNIPLIFFIDTPGFLLNPEEEQSKEGFLRTVPKTTMAICESTVPKIAVYVGENSGVARLVMGNLRMGIDYAYAWPTAKVSRISATDTINIIYADEIGSSENPEATKEIKIAEITKNHLAHPFHAAELALVNDLIDPRDTRSILIRTLEMLENKQVPYQPHRKHILMPQ